MFLSSGEAERGVFVPPGLTAGLSESRVERGAGSEE